MPKSAAVKRPRISEAHVQEAVVQMLVLDNWRPIRTDPVSDRGRGKGFGEPGMPDMLFLRYDPINTDPAMGYWGSTFGSGLDRHGHPDASWAEDCNILWVEFKAAGEKPKPHQTTWHDRERARGALVMTFDSVDSAREWYRGSGLMRNKILT